MGCEPEVPMVMASASASLGIRSDERIREMWKIWGPQSGEEIVTRSLHDWDFLALLCEVAARRGIKLEFPE